jgi:3-oxoacyl-[acyl-carrier protein] reductase
VDLGLDRKIGLVTAASRGLGFAVAEALIAEGASVAISSRDQGSLEQSVARLGAGAERVLAHAADLTDAAAVEKLLDATFERFGRVDILVCNTGGPRTANFTETSIDDWHEALKMLFFPVLQLVQRVIPSMRETGGGRIVFLTSSWVKQPRERGVLSTAIRSAISGLSKHLANELAADNILVNQVLPGPSWTDRSREIVSSLAERRGVPQEVIKEEVMREVPLRRYALPEDVGSAVAFLCSERAAFITGVALQVDGGQIKFTL